MRTESLLNHIINNHPTYFWDDIIAFRMVDDVMDLTIGSKYQIKEAINLLDTNGPYKVEDDVFTDFGSKTSYKKSETAMKHIQKHPDKHIEKYIDAVKQGMTKDTLKQLLTFIMNKPVRVIDDEKEVQKRVRQEMDIEKAKFKDEIVTMRRENQKAKFFMERDEIKQIEEQISLINILRTENMELRSIKCKLEEELKQYDNFYVEAELNRRKTLIEEGEQMTYYEKATKEYRTRTKKMEDKCEAKLKKMEEDNEKKLKKLKEEMAELTTKYNDKERKYKRDIKKYQHEIKGLKLKSKNSSSDDTNSDSNSD